MKHWTLAEIKSAKIKLKIEYQMGKVKMQTKELVIRPYQMDEGDLELFLAIIQEHSK